MRDLRHEPVHGPMEDFYDPRIQWVGVGALLLVLGGLLVTALVTGGERQMASTPPAIETTGSGGSGTLRQ